MQESSKVVGLEILGKLSPKDLLDAPCGDGWLSDNLGTAVLIDGIDLYSKPNLKKRIKKRLSFGSKISVTEKKGYFFKFDNFWIKKNDLKKINFKTKDIFKYVKKFTNTKYSWGGRHFSGIDCSGFVQIFFNFNNRFCPRDTKDQIKFFKKKLK